jgi:inhibitor of KinA sporulation pathway (predicted exonuclease)
MIRPHNIVCQHLDNDELYIGADHKVYPCCYLYDSQFDKRKTKTNMYLVWDEYGTDFNSLKHHKLEDILHHEWFDGVIEESLNKDHPLNCERCWKSCGSDGIRLTEKYEKK